MSLRPPLHSPSWRRAVAAVVVALLLPMAPLLAGLDGPAFDATSYFAPSWMLVADHARAGRLLLWNPFVEGGSPDGAQPEFGALSPLTLLVGLLFGGTLMGFWIFMLVLWLLAGLGMLGLARHLGAPPWGGLVVTVGWLFSATLLGHFQHTSWFCSYAAIPWVIWRLDVALRERKRAPAVEAGAILGLSGLSGYPGLVIQTGVLAVVWSAGRALTAETPPAAPRRAVAEAARAASAVVMVAMVSVVVVAPAWIGFLQESRGYTWRSEGLPRTTMVHDNALHPGALVSLASPYLHVVAAFWAPERWAPTDASSLGLYSGAVVAGLAVFALARRPRRRWLWWLVGASTFFVVVSIDALPLRGLLYDLLPWERFARHGSQRKDFAVFLLVVLAAHGAADLGVGRSPIRRASQAARRLFLRSTLATAVVAVVCAVLGWAWLGQLGPRPAFAVAHLLLAWGGLVTAAAVMASRRRALRSWAPGLLVLVAALDAAGSYRLCRVLMVDRARSPEVWERIARERRDVLDLTAQGLARDLSAPDWTWPQPNNQNLPLGIAAFDSYSVLTNPFRVGTARDPQLAGTALGEDRVWFAPSARVVPADEEGWAELVGSSRRLGSAVLVVHPPEAMLGGSAATGGAGAGGAGVAAEADDSTVLRPVEWSLRHLASDRVEITVTAPTAGWVLLTDRWARGWCASIDGRKTPIWGGNLIFRALPVEAGPRTLSFVYRPKGLLWLLPLSWGALVVTGVAALRHRIRRAPFRQRARAHGVEARPSHHRSGSAGEGRRDLHGRLVSGSPGA